MEFPCPHCKNTVRDTDFFCPHCGLKLKEPPLSTSVWKQINIYALAVFLPPFGLIPAIKYMRGDTQKAKIIGWVTMALTIIVIVVTIILTLQVIDTVTKTIQDTQSQLQNVGY